MVERWVGEKQPNVSGCLGWYHKIQIQAQIAAGGPFEKDQRVFPKEVKKFGVPEFVVVFGRRQLDTASCIDAAVR
jgi:hypothetical protein